MSKVLATLDFDGVVSPIDHGRDFEADESFEVFRIGFFYCAISRETLEFLQTLGSLAEAYPDQVAVRWASSWDSLTEDFAPRTDFAIPQFDYILTGFDKSGAIAEAAIEVDASVVLVFEDHRGVHQELRNIWKKDERFADRTLISYQPKTTEGIRLADILEAKGILANEIQKGS